MDLGLPWVCWLWQSPDKVCKNLGLAESAFTCMACKYVFGLSVGLHLWKRPGCLQRQDKGHLYFQKQNVITPQPALFLMRISAHGEYTGTCT